MTQIGIISDIHGAFQRLKLAHQLLKSFDVATVICAGDLVDRGEHNEDVVNYIKSEKIPTIQGNHDADPTDIDNFEILSFLDALPFSLNLSRAGTQISVFHGTPWHQEQHVFPHDTGDLPHRVLDVCQSDIIILGHTHIPMCMIAPDKRMIVNPGAVFGLRNKLKISTCAVLDLSRRDFKVYDIESRERYPLVKIHI